MARLTRRRVRRYDPRKRRHVFVTARETVNQMLARLEQEEKNRCERSASQRS
jgi:hypothetical protein